VIKTVTVSSFQDEEAVHVAPCQDKYKVCFEYVDVAGQFTVQDHELYSENVDSLSIKEEIRTEQISEMSSETVIVSAVKEEESLVKESACCFENTPGMCLSTVDISIKQEPVDEISIKEDLFAVGEIGILDTLLFKRETTENHTCFTDTAQIKEETVEEHCAEDVSGTEKRNCVPFREKTASSVSLNIQRQSLIGACVVPVSEINEEEKQGYTETNKVFRLVH
jgi:hypothetical protein